MNSEKKITLIINVLFIFTVGVLVYVFFSYILGLILPFVIGFSIAFILKPVVGIVAKRFRIKWKWAAPVVVTLVYLTIGLLLWLILFKLVTEMSTFFANLPELYKNDIEPALLRLNVWLTDLYRQLFPHNSTEFSDLLGYLVGQIGSIVTSFSTSILSSVTTFAVKIPVIILTLAFSIISSYLISADYQKITAFIMRQIPEKHRNLPIEIKEFMVSSIWGMARAYIIIMSITFVELSIGLSIIKVQYAIPIALLISLLDVLPLIGAGGVLVPWALISLVRQDFRLGIGIAVIYVTITVVRSFTEPKIIGSQIGLHPIVTLSAMFLGVRLFGFFGLIGMPILVMILKKLNDAGKIKLWREVSADS